MITDMFLKRFPQSSARTIKAVQTVVSSHSGSMMPHTLAQIENYLKKYVKIWEYGNMLNMQGLWLCLCLCLEHGYISVLLLSYSILSGALGSPSILLP